MKEKRHKNLLIATSTFPQGPEDKATARFVLDLALSMREHYKVFVLAPHYPGGRSFEEYEGIKVIRFKYFVPTKLEALATGSGMLSAVRKNPLTLLQLPFFILCELLALIRTARRYDIDIINSHWAVPQGVLAAITCKMLRIDHVVTLHAAGVFLLRRMGFLGRMLLRFTANNSDRFLPVSSYIDSVAKEIADMELNSVIIPMGVDPDRFKPLLSREDAKVKLDIADRKAFLFVGKFVEKKGIKTLLSAADMLKRKRDDFTILLVGGGILEEDMKNLSQELSLNDNVKFLGWVNNFLLRDIYTASDVVVIPSVFDRKGETEGMPVVVLESLAAGRSILASRISGIPDVVKDGINGCLVEPASSEDLCRQMDKLIDTDLGSYESKAIETAEEYSYENIAIKYRDAMDDRSSSVEVL